MAGGRDPKKRPSIGMERDCAEQQPQQAGDVWYQLSHALRLVFDQSRAPDRQFGSQGGEQTSCKSVASS